ncbi:uncharacterized protein PHACADRAFT_140452 [Phanerochaete carnosa HHB-10118-sp]|uniref:DUF6533 domain-containing protein n=1 Tax=Phanerochaete carnosa (strain HHB-10118-sp) TaxID=650164 RepID=K5X6J5_PHACS|nr:uncharacterized protein PHACADRAFT_140452 [Phanerochaete carnosa HHB-10118-sp]EKM58487.1 hypothetical protein PHACADRAFT_140452 [Phanerochaete carnosa HHB-10118-sp]
MFQTSSKTVLTDPGTFAGDAAVQNYVCAAMMTLILWDHVITLSGEIRFIWRRKLSLVTALFIINRYGVLVYGALAIATEFVDGQAVRPLAINQDFLHTAHVIYHSCTYLTRVTETMVLLLMLLFGICSALRTYALWNKNLQLFLVVLTLNLIPFGANLYLYISVTPITTRVTTTVSCLSYMPLTGHEQIQLIAAARVSTILVDIIVLSVTLIKTFETQRVANRLHVQVPLTTMLIRDGTIYFLTVLSMNIAQLVVFHTTEQVYLISFICTVTAILVSRFFLDLRETATGGLEYNTFRPDDSCERTTPLGRDLEELVLDTPIITECGSTSDSHETPGGIQEVWGRVAPQMRMLVENQYYQVLRDNAATP